MSKTITLRLNDEVYRTFRALADRDNRPLSNFIETATLRFIQENELMDEAETAGIRADRGLSASLKRGARDAASKRGRFV